MRKLIKYVVVILIVAITAVCSYLYGTTQAKTITIVKKVQVIPSDCILLEDLCGWYYNKYGYICFELADMERKYSDILLNLPYLEDLEQ